MPDDIERLAERLREMEAREAEGYPDPEYHGTQVEYQWEINEQLPDPEPDFPPNIHE